MPQELDDEHAIAAAWTWARVDTRLVAVCALWLGRGRQRGTANSSLAAAKVVADDLDDMTRNPVPWPRLSSARTCSLAITREFECDIVKDRVDERVARANATQVC